MTEPEISQPVPENDTASATATEETLAPEIGGRAASRALDGGACERMERLLRFLRQVGGASPGIHGLVQLCDGLAPLAAFEDRPIDRRPRVAGDDRRFLVHGKRTAVDRLPWLFQWSHAALYKLVVGFGPRQPDRPDGQSGQRRTNRRRNTRGLERAWCGWRRPGSCSRSAIAGPGLWWSAIFVTLALGVVYHPAYGIMMGGIAGPGVRLALDLGLTALCLRDVRPVPGVFAGQRRGTLALDPDFLLWANIDESFLTGLVVLAAAAVGRLARRDERDGAR